MIVERIVVRLVADTSHYLAAFSKAENKLQSFGTNIAKIQERYNRAVETANARHMNAIENAAHRQNQIARLASRNFDFATRTYERQHQQSIDRATQRHQRMNSSANRLRQQEVDSVKRSFVTARMDADRFMEESNRRMRKMTTGGGIIDQEFARTKLLAQRRFNRASLFAQSKIDPNTGAVSLTNKGQQTVAFAQSRYDAVMQLAKERKQSERDKAFDANTADLQRYARMMETASGRQRLAIKDANSKHSQSILAAQDQLNRATARADRLKDNASIKSVEARNKAVEQANLRYQNAVRNADFRRDMTVKAAGLTLKDDKANAALKNKMEAMRHSEEFRDRLSHDLRIVSYAATAAFGFIAYEAIKLGASFQKAGIELEVMTGNATVAQQLLKDIQTLAIESPFQTSDLVQSAKQVKAFGFETSQIIPILSRLGDVSSGTGADMDRVILAFGQVRTTGRLMGQELRQFTNAGIPILEYLAKVMGVTEQQMPNLVRQGKVSFGDVAKAFNMMTDSGGIFSGMMERINKETIYGRWQNFKENLQLAAIQLGLGAFEGLKLNEVLTNLADNIRGFEKGQVTEFFANFRKGIELTWIVAEKLWTGLTDLLSAVNINTNGIKSWIMRNEQLLVSIGSVVGFLVVWSVSIRLAILAIRILILTLGVLRVVFLSFTFVATIIKAIAVTFGFLIAVVKSTIAVVMFFKTVWLGLVAVGTAVQAVFAALSFTFQAFALGPIGLALVGILALSAAVLTLISYTEGLKEFGSGWNFGKDFLAGFNDMKTLIPEVWTVLKETFQAGDLEATFEVLWKTIQYGWKSLVLNMKWEFQNMIEQIGADLMTVMSPDVQALMVARTSLIVSKKLSSVGTDLNTGIADAGVAEIDKVLKLRYAMGRTMTSGMFADTPREKLVQLGLLASDRMKLQKDLSDIRTRTLFDSGTGKAIYKDVISPIWENKNLDAVKHVEPYTKLPGVTNQNVLAGAIGFPGVEAVQEKYGEIYRDVVKKMVWVKLLAVAGKFGTEDMQLAVKEVNESVKFLDQFSDALPGVVQAAGKLAKVAIYPVPSYPEHVTHLLRELEKEIEDGISPMDKYTRSMNALNMAFEGMPLTADQNPMKNLASPFGSVMGAYAPYVNSRLLPIADKTVYDIGTFKEFEKLRNSIHDRRGEGTPAMLYGSREAADTIARNNQQALSVHEQVLQTLRDAHEVEKGTRDYTKRVGDVLESMRGDGDNQNGWSIFQGFRKGQ